MSTRLTVDGAKAIRIKRDAHHFSDSLHHLIAFGAIERRQENLVVVLEDGVIAITPFGGPACTRIGPYHARHDKPLLLIESAQLTKKVFEACKTPVLAVGQQQFNLIQQEQD